MLAEDFDMANYPQMIDGKPASKYWRIGYLDPRTGYDRWLNVNQEYPQTFLSDSDIVESEKKLKGAPIKSVRFGCVYFQEEPNGEWFETKLSKAAVSPDHFFNGNYTDQYFDIRTEAYRRTGNRDIFKLKAPTRQADVDQKKIQELQAEIERLKADKP